MTVAGRRHAQRVGRWEASAARRRIGQSGQATVELALLLPLVCALLIVVLQVGLVVRSQVLLVHLTREAARGVALAGGVDVPTMSPDTARAAGLVPERLEVVIGAAPSGGGLASVHSRYRQPVVVPLLGLLHPDLLLTSQLTVRSEP